MPRGGAKERAGKLPEAVVERITAMKRSNPDYGVKRISQVLRRIFFFKASPETVRKTLHREQLMPPVRRKSKKNPQKPRFFERSTPNQLWQSDIFCFRLGGENAYLIGFIDDYSRYITGLGVYRGQTAENVLEVYRQARGEYGVPKEMLTDNGRQYTNWRGKTKFEHGDAAGPDTSLPEPAASPDDTREDRTFLEDDLGGVPGESEVRFLRERPAAHHILGEILQPQASAPGDRRGMSCRPVLQDPQGDEGGDREGRGRERAGAGDTW